MFPAPLLGVYQVGHSWAFKLEVYSLCCFEAFTSFRYEILSCRAFRCQAHQGRAFGSSGDTVFESRSVKRKSSDSVEKDRPSWGKVPKLGASSSSHVRVLGQALPPLVEVLKALSSQPRSSFTAKTKDSSGRAAEQPLEVMPISVWNPPRTEC